MLKKTAYILALCILSHHFLFAQNASLTSYKSSVRAGVLYTSFGLGDLKGLSYYNEYNRQLSHYVSFSPSVQVGFGSVKKVVSTNDLANGVRFNKASIGADLNFFVLPVQSERFNVRLGAGPSFRYFSDSYPSSYSIYSLPSLPPGTPYVISPFTYPRDQNYLAAGYNLVVDGEVNLSDHWLIGVRGSYQGYTSKETVLSVGINTGYRF